MTLAEESVLVTGGAGFIGSHLVDRLVDESTERIIVLDDFSQGRRSNLKPALETSESLVVEEGDAADWKTLSRIVSENDVDVLFNLAVEPLLASFDDPTNTVRSNHESVLHCCELARRGDVQSLVHLSSSEVYGTRIEDPMDESHPLNPTTPYAASKVAGDKLVASYVRTFDIDARIVRPFNNFGPRQNYGDYSGVIPVTIKRILDGKAPVIEGSGSQTRDFIFVEDTVQAILSAYMTPEARGETVNVCTGEERSIEYVIETICNELGYNGDIIYKDERPADVECHRGDNSKARRLGIMSDPTPFESGMRITVDWYRDVLN